MGHKGHWGEYTGNAKWSRDHAHTRVTSKNYDDAVRDDAAHIDYLKRDVLYDDHHGHSDENMTADEKHISRLAGDMKYDKEHHGSPAKREGRKDLHSEADQNKWAVHSTYGHHTGANKPKGSAVKHVGQVSAPAGKGHNKDHEKKGVHHHRKNPKYKPGQNAEFMTIPGPNRNEEKPDSPTQHRMKRKHFHIREGETTTEFRNRISGTPDPNPKWKKKKSQTKNK